MQRVGFLMMTINHATYNRRETKHRYQMIISFHISDIIFVRIRQAVSKVNVSVHEVT